MKKETKILIAATEAVPYAKTGGLADVIGALPKALKNQGAEVRVVLPLYKAIKESKHTLKKVGKPFTVPMAGQDVEVSIKEGKCPNCKEKVYFVECDKYFDRDNLYQENGQDYGDNDERFALFSKAVIEMMKVVKYKPDVVHCNDWQTGLIPAYLKTVYAGDEYYQDMATVMTIHNIAYQGIFHHSAMDKIGLPWEIFNVDGVEYWGHVSYLKAGLVYSDKISTVSPTYAEEIQTTEQYGKGLEGLLRSRTEDLMGILNGLDYTVWNPAKDNHLYSNFESSDLRGKSRNKKGLQKELSLETENIPVISMISRLDDHKGFDLVAAVFEEVMKEDVQMVILGVGEPRYHEMLERMQEKYPDKVSVNLRFDNPLAHKIYAGSDMFLMPSKTEPCGIGQMIAMKYGAMPVVYNTGGLADTVIDYTEDPNEGNGFVFTEYTSDALLDAIMRGVETYSNKRKWNSIVKDCMKLDFSWKSSASKYMEMYEMALEKKMSVAV